ncbi:MAG TPA: hypothetical protein VGK19_22755 [Capsulimonadaceae bacterium]|jgi:hypothetical protein
MITPTTTPRTRRLRVAAIVTATLAALGAALYAIDTRTDAISCALRIPAKLDASTPAKQGGFELVAIKRSVGSINIETKGVVENTMGYESVGNTLIGFRCRWMPKPVRADAKYPYWSGVFRATGRSSTGSSFKFLVLPACVRASFTDPELGTVPPTFAVSLSGTYPDSYRWIDLTVASADGHKGTWRITRLPRTHRTFPVPARVGSDVVTKDGVRVAFASAKARRYDQVKYEVFQHPFKAGPGEHWQYESHMDATETEWETRDHANRRAENWPPNHSGQPGVLSAGHETARGHADSVDCPYPENHYLRVHGELSRVATMNEPITFHDVPIQESTTLIESGQKEIEYRVNTTATMDYRTPSGAVIKLSGPPFMFGNGTGTLVGLHFLVRTTPAMSTLDSDFSGKYVPLPESPLSKQYGKPLRLTLSADSLKSCTTGMRGDDCIEFMSDMPPFTGTTLKTLPLTLTQHCAIERIPVSVIVATRAPAAPSPR